MTALNEFDVSYWTRESQAERAARFLSALPPDRVYRYGPGLLLLTHDQQPIPIPDGQTFIDVAGFLVRFVREKPGRSGTTYTVSVDPPPPLGRQLFRSLSSGPGLPRVKAVFQQPTVLLKDGTPYLHPIGYNPASETLYLPEPETLAIEPRPGTHHLSTALSCVPFADEEDRRRLIAWLLGGLVYDPTMIRPLLVVSGNRQGIGKTTLVEAVGYILDGRPAHCTTARGAELQKFITSRFLQSERLIFIDNVNSSRPLDNDALASMTTQGSVAIRILGQNEFAYGNPLFALTVNEAKLSRDLTTRALAVNLFQENPEKPAIFVRDYAERHRAEIYGELLNLALSSSDYVVPPDQQFRFVAWQNFVVPRVVSAFGPCPVNPEAADSPLDAEEQEILHFGVDNPGSKFTLPQLVALLTSSNSFPSLRTNLLGRPSTRSRCTFLQQTLKRLGKTTHQVAGTRVAILRDETTDPTTYQFQEEIRV